ncbi:MAG: hypothetical protein ACP5H3_02060 [Candidatus Aenigmatarchaeota archaeon]|uniref:hypothetical protein n=1 Tax=Caldisericum sp. TaxID=2499687 RepID=UPI003D148E19
MRQFDPLIYFKNDSEYIRKILNKREVTTGLLSNLDKKTILAIMIAMIASGFVILFPLLGENHNSKDYDKPKKFAYNKIIDWGWNNDENEDYNEQKVLTYDEAISEFWDEIKDYIDGIETIEACFWKSGNCYSVDADISGGKIETIYFNNGKYLNFSADIDEQGSAWDFDENGNIWDFTIDMHSPIIEDAVYEWAEDNGYTIE